MSKKVVGIAVAVLLFAALAPSLTAQPVTLLAQEQFEGTFPPAGWTTTNQSGNNQWFRNDYWGRINYAGGSGFCADNDDDAAYYSAPWCRNNALVTPAFDATGVTNIHLHYTIAYNNISANDEVRVEAYDGEGWNEVITYTSDVDAYGPGRIEDRNITPFVADVPNAQVRFVYNEINNTWAWWVEIDAVSITGEAGGGPPPEGVDLEMVQIIRPMVEEEGGEAFNPTCRVYNPLENGQQPTEYLEATVEAEIRCRIKDMETQQTVYEDVLHAVPLEFGYNEIDAFRSWTPDGNKLYQVLFVVTHEDDPNEQNNDKTLQFTTAAGVTVDATAILAPASDDQQGYFSPSASYEAGAEADASGVILHCKIEDATYGAVVFEEEKGPVDITAGDSYTETFSEVTDLVDGSAYTITFWAEIDKSDVGEMVSKTFNYIEAIAENPVVDAFDLKVSGTAVNFNLGKATSVSLRVYDIAGNVVSTLAEGSYAAGSHNVSIEGLGSGVYFVKMVTPLFTDVAKVTVVK